MLVHILIEWDLGNGENILAVYEDEADAVAHAERAASEFNKHCPGHKADESRCLAKRDTHPPTNFTASWSFGTGGWCIAMHEVK